MLRIRLASPHVSAPSGAGECEALRRATAVANHALFMADMPACSKRTAMAVNFRSQCPDENFALGCVCRYVSRLLLGHRSGASPAPGGTRSSASRSAPLWGHGSSQNKFANHGKKRRANFFRAHSEKADLRPWEPGPLARLRPV